MRRFNSFIILALANVKQESFIGPPMKVYHKIANKILHDAWNPLFVTNVATLVKCVLISQILQELLSNTDSEDLSKCEL